MTTYAKYNILEPIIKRLNDLKVNYTVFHDVDDSDTEYGINNRKIQKYLLDNNINCKIRPVRVGKFNNIILALKELFLKEDFVIVIDDDILLTESYLNFCKYASEKYKNDESIAGVVSSNLFNFYTTSEYYYISENSHPSMGLGIWKDRFVKYSEKLNLLKYINSESKLDVSERVKENLSFFRDGKHLDMNSDVIFSLAVEFFKFKLIVNCSNQIDHLDQIEMSRSKQEISKYLAPVITDIPNQYTQITDKNKIQEMDEKRRELSIKMNNEPRQLI